MLALSGVVGLPYHPLPLVVLLLEFALVALTMTALGALGAVFIRRIETFQTVLSLAMMPLFFLSGALFTVRGLPRRLNALTLVNPLTYAVDALRRTVAWGFGPGLVPAGPRWGGVVPPAGLELAAMCTLGLGALLLAAHRFAHAGD
jgi:ABC-2 type transport system permease protein